MEEAVDKEDAKEEKKAVEIAEYLDYNKMFYEQKGKYNIYCIIGESEEVVSASAFVEKLKKRGFKGVYVAEYVNKYCVQQFKVLVSVTKEGLELPEDQDKFSTGVRMVERKLLIKFLQVLPPKVKSLTQIRGYYIINDAMEFYKFLDLCLKKLVT